MSKDYHNEQQFKLGNKIDTLLKSQPACCREFYSYMINNRNKSIRTCYTYIINFRSFFDYITTHKLERITLNKKPSEITCDELEQITENDFYDYLSYLTAYNHDGIQKTNSPKSKNNKLSALKSLYRYLAKTHRININTAANVDFTDIPKSKKTPVHLEIDETASLIDIAENYQKQCCYTRQAKTANSHIRYRDLAILMLLCSTGLRVSEMVALNIEDINFKNNSLTIYRKGGFEQDVFINQETADSLSDYLKHERPLLSQNAEKAVFLSMRHKRLSVRSVESLVNKYTILLDGCDKGNGRSKITPHRLRATYASLFLENNIGDLKELSENMGHSSTATTAIYTGVTKDAIRRKQAEKIRLREP